MCLFVSNRLVANELSFIVDQKGWYILDFFCRLLNATWHSELLLSVYYWQKALRLHAHWYSYYAFLIEEKNHAQVWFRLSKKHDPYNAHYCGFNWRWLTAMAVVVFSLHVYSDPLVKDTIKVNSQ